MVHIHFLSFCLGILADFRQDEMFHHAALECAFLAEGGLFVGLQQSLSSNSSNVWSQPDRVKRSAGAQKAPKRNSFCHFILVDEGDNDFSDHTDCKWVSCKPMLLVSRSYALPIHLTKPWWVNRGVFLS
jgi:hypothetical protein